MFAQFRRAARAMRPASASERELAYLNAACDLHDLEARERDVDRGLLRDRPLGL
jgi:hypothetical protein